MGRRHESLGEVKPDVCARSWPGKPSARAGTAASASLRLNAPLVGVRNATSRGTVFPPPPFQVDPTHCMKRMCVLTLEFHAHGPEHHHGAVPGSRGRPFGPFSSEAPDGGPSSRLGCLV